MDELEEKEEKQEEKVIEKYTPVKVFIVFLIIGIIAFLIITNLRSYEKGVGDILHPKPLKGTDAELMDRAVTNNDPEYCQNIKDSLTKQRCSLLSTPGALDTLQKKANDAADAIANKPIPHPPSPGGQQDGEKCMLLPLEQQTNCFEQLTP